MQMKRYKKYIMPYLSSFILAPIMMLTEVAGEVLLPELMAMIINNGVATRDIGYIVRIGIIMFITVCFTMTGGVLAAYFAVKASVNFTADMRQDVFDKIQEFSFSNIDDFSTGSLVTRLTNDMTQVQSFVMMILRQALRSPGLFVGALIMAMMINRRLATIIVIVIPFMALSIFLILRVAYPRFQAMQRKIDRLNSGVQESLTNVRVVKSFVREDYEEDKFETLNSDLREGSIHAMKIVMLMMPLMTLFMNICTIAVVWRGGNMVIAGEMMVGDLTAFTTYIVQILSSLMQLSMLFLQSSRAMASARRINEVLDTEPDLNDNDAKCKDKLVSEGKVEFRNVSFCYKGTDAESDLVLEDISFTVDPGQTVGIIGTTGCGKTSLVQLIPRLYDVTSGEVLVDDTDVRDYSIENLREGVGMVLQKNDLFSGSIDENLRWGNEDATPEEVRAAAAIAQADGFINDFTDGYENEIGQGGTGVSGGQKQRLCIARALLKNPKILILDDSTSAVDTATEAMIRKSFSNELKNTTKFIIAQRITSVQDADLILVMENGKIIGQGTHEELIKTCDVYEEIWSTQSGEKKENTPVLTGQEVMA